MDSSILLLIQQMTGLPPLDHFMTALSLIGDDGIIWCLITVALLINPKTRKCGVVCALSLILSLLFCNVLLKNLIARPRPYLVIDGLHPIVPLLSDFSFPSGHASSSFAFVTAVYLSELNKKWAAIVFVIALMISFSRLYVGVHYPTDVLGGVILGILCGHLANIIIYGTAEL